MPANLPPQYNKAEEEFRRATTPAERLEKLRELFRLLPKHKGTEKLQAELKQKISRARDDLEGSKTAGKKSGVSTKVPHEGAGQIVLIGPPNAGKSAILGALTNARPEVAAYPFTTRSPQPGIMHWQDVRIQLIDLPPITTEFFEPWMTGIVRSADAALLVADLADDDGAEAAEVVLNRLAQTQTEFVAALPFDSDDESLRHLKTALIANKVDTTDAGVRLEVLNEWFRGRFTILPTSAQRGDGLDDLRALAYDLLGLIRIYTKVPGKPVDRTNPFTVPKGSTVMELAREVHCGFEQTLKFAKIWGSGVFEGQTVKKDHELSDCDVVELHT